VSSRAPSANSSESGRYERLRLYNLIVGAAHLAQVVALLALSNDFTLPVTRQFAAGPPGSGMFAERDVLWDVRIGPAVALFLALAAAG
jgi:heliorhodopsin